MQNFPGKLFKKGILPNSLYEAIITLIPKLRKGITWKDSYRPISLIIIGEKNS